MIEKILLHENFEIQGNAEDGFYAKFVDAEPAPFIVRFHFDNCATIETEWSALGLLSYLVEKTDKMYKDYYKSLKK